MYYRFLMYALVSPETFLILLLYRLNLSQFCLKFIWTSNYLIKEIISQTVVVLFFWFCYQIFFWFWCNWQSSVIILITLKNAERWNSSYFFRVIAPVQSNVVWFFFYIEHLFEAFLVTNRIFRYFRITLLLIQWGSDD